MNDYQGHVLHDDNYDCLMKIIKDVGCKPIVEDKGCWWNTDEKIGPWLHYAVAINDGYVTELAIKNKKLKEIPEGVEGLVHLKRLYLDCNLLTSISRLSNLRDLVTLDLSCNYINKLSGLEGLSNLKSLILFYNDIMKIEGLDNLGSLEFIDLGKNYISKIEGLDGLRNLKKLKLCANYIGKISNLNKLPLLKEIIIDYNPVFYSAYQMRKLEKKGIKQVFV